MASYRGSSLPRGASANLIAVGQFPGPSRILACPTQLSEQDADGTLQPIVRPLPQQEGILNHSYRHRWQKGSRCRPCAQVRCDRQDPCDRCTRSSAPCLRTRQISHTRRKRTYLVRDAREISCIAAQLSDHDRRSVSSQLTQTSPHAETSGSVNEVDATGVRRVLTDPEQVVSVPGIDQADYHNPRADQVFAAQGNDAWPGLSEGRRQAKSPIAAGFEAETYLRKELATNNRLSTFERECLVVAIDLIPQVGGTRHMWSEAFEQLDLDGHTLDDPSMYLSAEAMCFLSNGWSPFESKVTQDNLG